MIEPKPTLPPPHWHPVRDNPVLQAPTGSLWRVKKVDVDPWREVSKEPKWQTLSAYRDWENPHGRHNIDYWDFGHENKLMFLNETISTKYQTWRKILFVDVDGHTRVGWFSSREAHELEEVENGS